MAMAIAYADPVRPADDVVYLLGDPYVMQDGRTVRRPRGLQTAARLRRAQRGRVDRRHAAGSLWPDGTGGSGLGQPAVGAVAAARRRHRRARVGQGQHLPARAHDHRSRRVVRVGRPARRRARRARRTCRSRSGASTVAELLPGWYDDWVIFERERVRQRMLHALEVLSCLLRTAGRYGEAIDAAMDAVAVEPLRESAHRVLAEAHVAEGNFIEARRSYVRYRDIARRELGVEPSAAFRAWLQSCVLVHTA